MGKMRARPLIAIIPLLLSAVYFLILELSKPPSGLKPKVFVIGLSKTGTTSTGVALDKLGYRRLGWLDIRSRHLVHSHIQGDYDALKAITQYYDAFEDLPWPGMYREMAALYPDAKFVLTLRRDEQAWLRSAKRHMSRGSWAPAKFWYGMPEFIEGQEETLLARYRNHTDSVRHFFADKPERYAELVVDDGDACWKALGSVTGFPGGVEPSIPFPKVNTIADWDEGGLLGWAFRTRGKLLSGLESAIADLYYGGKHPWFNLAIERVWHAASTINLAYVNLSYAATAFWEQRVQPTFSQDPGL